MLGQIKYILWNFISGVLQIKDQTSKELKCSKSDTIPLHCFVYCELSKL